MIGINIRMLRKKHKMSQELLAEKVNVSRQTVAKWENDEALPDLQKSKMLANIFQITLDQLSETMSQAEIDELSPMGKQFFGVVKVGQKGEFIIPKRARDIYQIEPDDKLVVLGEDVTKGIAIMKVNGFIEFADMIQKATSEEEVSE